MKVAIIGLGREGQSLYRYLRQQPEFRQADVWILDQNPKVKPPAGSKKQLGQNYLKGLDGFDLIFRSPGVPHRLIKQRLENWRLEIRNYELRLSSATKLFFEKCPCPIIGVTGTKGKGTTSTLIYKICQACGRDVYLAGNIGQPALDILPKLKIGSLVILELSSFQLQDLERSPQVAVVLDIFPDHLDAHKNLKEYVEAKSQIARHQQSSDVIFYFVDNKDSLIISKKSRGRKISIYHYISRKDRADLRRRVKIPGLHNWRNAQAAFAVTRYLGCPRAKIFKTIAKFRGNEHRLELVRRLNGVRYYNDSASTNPQTTIAAAKAFKEPKIIIAGGYDKNLDYRPWGEEFTKRRVKAVILIGQTKNKIKKILSPKLSSCEDHNLKGAAELAKDLAKPGWLVLFSPGAASFDMFEDYRDRGQKFKKIVKSL